MGLGRLAMADFSACGCQRFEAAYLHDFVLNFIDDKL